MSKRSRRTEVDRCYECGGEYLGGEQLRLHVSQQLARGSHADPPAEWLEARALAHCRAAGHPPWVYPACKECGRCTKEGQGRRRRNAEAAETASRCWGCAWMGSGTAHFNEMLGAGRHPRPRKGWLDENGVRLCVADGHKPHVFTGAACPECQRIRAGVRRRAAAAEQQQPHRTEKTPRPVVRTDPAAFAVWLRGDEALPAVERAVHAAEGRREPARRFLPAGRAGKRAAASAFVELAKAVADGVAAAQALFPYAPKVLMRRHVPLSAAIGELMDGGEDWRDGAERPPTGVAAPMDAYVRRVRAAVTSRDFRAINRLLEDGHTGRDGAVDAAIARKVVREKFPTKPDGEMPHGGADEEKWYAEWAARCGGDAPPISQRDLVRWARAKRDKAADVGGYSGRLILELHQVDGAVTAALAEVYSMPPERWVHRGGATATWRVLKGSFIPQPTKPLPRPVATASVPRRAWGSATARKVRDEAAAYCETAGQYGMSRAGGQTAYVLAARTLLACGADLVVDDRTNSFHELYRRSVVDACSHFLSSMNAERLGQVGRPLVDLLARTFLGPVKTVPSSQLLPRSRYVFTQEGVAPKVHHALAQGSSESSLLEALTYAYGRTKAAERAGVVRCELHDDGYTAVMSGVGIEAFARAPADDGSRVAVAKDKALGPRAAEVVAAGHSREVVKVVNVAGVPVGDVADGLARWRERFRKKVARLLEIAAIDVALAAAAATAVGGPAGLANHILRATEPTPEATAFWREVDDEWVGMWLKLVCVPATCAHEAALVRDGLSLSKALRQVPAADIAGQRYAEGVRDAAVHLGRILARAGVPMDKAVWDAIGATPWHEALQQPGSAEVGWDAGTLRAAASLKAAQCAKALADADDARWRQACERERGEDYVAGPSSSSTTRDDDDEPPNLFMAWLRLRPPDGGPTLSRADGLVALRRMFRLPVTAPGTGVPSPRSCRRCNAPPAASFSHAEGGSPPSTHPPPPTRKDGPMATVDWYGEHALVCPFGGETQRRHNTLAYAIRDCIRAAGWDASCSAGKIFASHGGRPADVWVEGHPQHAAGLAIDCTVVSAVAAGRVAGPQVAAAAEGRKRRKYAAEVAQHPGLGFEPFGVDLGGRMGPAAWAQAREWARVQASHPANDRTHSEALEWVVGTLAHAFVNGCVRQIRAFADAQQQQHQQRRCAENAGRPTRERGGTAGTNPGSAEREGWPRNRERDVDDDDEDKGGDGDEVADGANSRPSQPLGRRRRLIAVPSRNQSRSRSIRVAISAPRACSTFLPYSGNIAGSILASEVHPGDITGSSQNTSADGDSDDECRPSRSERADRKQTTDILRGTAKGRRGGAVARGVKRRRTGY